MKMKAKSKVKTAKQLEFINFQTLQERKLSQKFKKGFGGELQCGRRKEKRPLSTTKPIHLVLKSETVKFFGPRNKSLKRLIYKTAEKYSIKVYKLALNHNHIHFVLKLKTKENYNYFIRELTSKMAVAIRKYLIQTKDSRVLDLKNILSHPPFTRIISWGKDFSSAINYVVLNILESEGYIKRQKSAFIDGFADN